MYNRKQEQSQVDKLEIQAVEVDLEETVKEEISAERRATQDITTYLIEGANDEDDLIQSEQHLNATTNIQEATPDITLHTPTPHR